MIKVLQKRCKHRHTAKSHPHCFVDGKPVEGGYIPKNSQYAKVLVVDIENLPGIFRLFNTGKQYVSINQMDKAPIMLSWAAKWLYDHEVYGRVLSSKNVINRDESELLPELWQLLNEADIIVGHNVIHHDLKIINTKFIKYGFPSPMYYKIVDTLPIARSLFDLPSYSLSYINEYLGLTPKLHTTPGLWTMCEQGDKDALDEMLAYNRNDVFIEEETYTTLRPWMKSHPEMAIYANSSEGGVCSCGSTNLEKGGFYSTGRARYQAYRCKDCGAIGRFPKNILPKKKETNNES